MATNHLGEKDHEHDYTECPVCGTTATEKLGVLGRRAHYRCIACGIDFSKWED